MAEYYSAELAEKVTRGMKENALKGLWNGGNVPFGYVINKERKLDIDPQAAPVVQEIFKLSNDGKTVKEIYNIMNERKVTRSNGKALRYNAIRYILSNRVYIGEYHHMGVVIENSVPPLVSEELFNAVQLELAKNSKAPARHSADEDYLLTTKLFCGRCGAMMVAQTGTSGTKGIVYRYYACVRQKKHQCEKKPVSKTKLEDFIVYKTMEFLKDDGIIERLSAKLYELQYTESTVLPKLQEQLKQKEKEIENIVNAVQKGYATETLLKRLDGLEKEKHEISDAIAKEQLKAPIFKQDHFRMALYNFRKIDITTQEGKRKIIDTFINSIYLYDDHLKIIYNANSKEETVSLAELESSTLFSRGAPDSIAKPRPFTGGAIAFPHKSARLGRALRLILTVIAAAAAGIAAVALAAAAQCILAVVILLVAADAESAVAPEPAATAVVAAAIVAEKLRFRRKRIAAALPRTAAAVVAAVILTAAVIAPVAAVLPVPLAAAVLAAAVPAVVAATFAEQYGIQ